MTPTHGSPVVWLEAMIMRTVSAGAAPAANIDTVKSATRDNLDAFDLMCSAAGAPALPQGRPSWPPWTVPVSLD
jgi:hypothetical protein